MRLVVLSALLLSLGAGASGAERVTLITTTNERLVGEFVGASAERVTIRVAGQDIHVPVANLARAVFRDEPVASDTDSATPASATAAPFQDAFRALQELQGALEIGLLRPQYSERLLATLPRVKAFVESDPEAWPDAKAALRYAQHRYARALGLSEWPNANLYWLEARLAVDYARQLVEQEPADRRESPTPTTIEFGKVYTGRLGAGDEGAPGYRDTYMIEIAAPARVPVKLVGTPFEVRFEVQTATGQKVFDGSGRIVEKKKDLQPGKYMVVVRSTEPLAPVGRYELTVGVP